MGKSRSASHINCQLAVCAQRLSVWYRVRSCVITDHTAMGSSGGIRTLSGGVAGLGRVGLADLAHSTDISNSSGMGLASSPLLSLGADLPSGPALAPMSAVMGRPAEACGEMMYMPCDGNGVSLFRLKAWLNMSHATLGETAWVLCKLSVPSTRVSTSTSATRHGPRTGQRRRQCRC
jgi:hypothetical protein